MLYLVEYLTNLYLVKCEFENGDICGWTQDASDQFDWQLGYGNTTSWATGPKWDHTYETGYGNCFVLTHENKISNFMEQVLIKKMTLL